MTKRPQCSCPAYSFPHRFRSGKCTGWEAVEAVFRAAAAANIAPCKDCPFHWQKLGAHRCLLILDGGDPRVCPGIHTYVKER